MNPTRYNGAGIVRDPGFLRRVWAMIVKEFVQMRRDRMTFATMLIVPIMQLVLFGYAINTDPKHLPAAVLLRDSGPLTRAVLASLKNTAYFDFKKEVRDPGEMDRMIRSGEVQFAIEIPASFERDVRRGDRPSILVIADATDPVATGTAISSLEGIVDSALRRELRGPDAAVMKDKAPFEITLQRRYNPEGITQYNIVPGLLGVVLTMTMMMFTALAVTREIERGTMESLLAMPIRPVEIMLGKIAPFVLVGFVQMTIILSAAYVLFGVPIAGSVTLLVILATLFAAANLAVGYTFSTVATNQLQAVQMTFFFFLPNILLSGFMFPYRGMPLWAQAIGEALPLTHFLRIVRGITLKGNGFADMHIDVPVPRTARKLGPVALPPVKVPASATGASATGALAAGQIAFGALAVGALAVGALAVGALAIGRLEIRKARLREVEIDSLTVRKLKVIEELDVEPDSTKQ